MHRIDGPGATVANQFTQGDPSTGVPATVVTAEWLNAIQEEIAKVIEGSGGTLSKPSNIQLFTAIQAITAASSGFTTGDVKLTLKQVADAGWIMANDGTIGSAGSAATTRANADTQALYTLLWNNVSNTWAPVTGGRGASAALDFAANKPLKLTTMLGRALAIAGTGSGLTGRQLGEFLGAQTHQLTAAEMPSHRHSVFLNDPGHNHTTNALNSGQATATTGGASTGISTATINPNTTGITVRDTSGGGGTANQTALAGSDGAHNNMQPTGFLNAMIKL